jgi:molybdopterin synthase sulfur carrier subunit
VRILFFGRVAEAAGTRETLADPPAGIGTAYALRTWLCRDDPALLAVLAHPSVRIAVNDEILPEDRAIAPDDEVAFMPPVSGG